MSATKVWFGSAWNEACNNMDQRHRYQDHVESELASFEWIRNAHAGSTYTDVRLGSTVRDIAGKKAGNTSS